MEELGLINQLLKQESKTPIQELKELLNSPPQLPIQKQREMITIQRAPKLRRLEIHVPDDCNRCDGDKIGYKSVLS